MWAFALGSICGGNMWKVYVCAPEGLIPWPPRCWICKGPKLRVPSHVLGLQVMLIIMTRLLRLAGKPMGLEILRRRKLDEACVSRCWSFGLLENLDCAK